jgi:hypothetical protein
VVPVLYQVTNVHSRARASSIVANGFFGHEGAYFRCRKRLCVGASSPLTMGD